MCPTQGRGRPAIVGLYRQVVITLILVRQNLSQVAVADLCGMSQPTVSRIYRRVLPVMDQALSVYVPEFSEVSDGRVVLVDGTDVPTRNRHGCAHLYSGKRRRAGLTVQIASDRRGRLLAVSASMPGSTHDRTVFAEVGWEHALRDCTVIADLGYQGTFVITPRKKPKNGQLSLGDKKNNSMISSIRSAVERCIAHWKNWKILATGYRGRLAELPGVIRVVTALEFYRLA